MKGRSRLVCPEGTGGVVRDPGDKSASLLRTQIQL
jgi:hypothetical protein